MFLVVVTAEICRLSTLPPVFLQLNTIANLIIARHSTICMEFMQPCEELMGMLSPCHFYALLEPKEIAENEKKHPPKEMLSIERCE